MIFWGLSITGSQVAPTALKLTLNTGATVTVLGGNTTAGIDQTDVNFATLVQGTLGTTVPTSGTTTGGAVVIGGAAANGTPVQGNNTVTATPANDVSYLDANGGQPVSLTLMGVTDAALVNLTVN